MAEAPAQATAPPSSWNLVEEVAAVSGLIADRAAAGRARRQVGEDVVRALKDAGFMRAVLPKRWGGLEATPQEFFAALLKIAEQDMSSAWIAGIIAVHAYQLALMDEQAQSDVYADDPDTLISSSYNPVGGRAEPCDGGFRLSGRWGWSSGSAHCTWVLLGAIVPGDGYRTFLVPRPDYRIEDTWFVYGLQATGSNDIVIDEPVFVPGHRTHRQMDGFNCVHSQDNPMYGIPWAQVFIRVVSTPAIGAARHAVDLFTGNAAASSTDPTKLQGDPDITRRVAEAINDIDEVETVMFRNFDRMMELVNAGEPIPMIDRVRYRYQASIVIDRMGAAVDRLFEVAGGKSVFDGAGIQDIWRDIHIARAHVANNPTPFARNLGGMTLGAENGDFFV
ncbi:MAG: flavin-dependent monooxygenase [Gammaproteobacteria bacterium]|nr:flavin-dependent monooxygenase [Gammaproteobacteria bacterium]MDE0366878.1 flavin-dependent monooxygenase [Gammaproteobacteria bacterium]